MFKKGHTLYLQKHTPFTKQLMRKAQQKRKKREEKMGDNTQYHIAIFKKAIPGCGRTDEIKEISRCRIQRSKIDVNCRNCLDFQQKEKNIESNYLEDGMGRKLKYIKVV